MKIFKIYGKAYDANATEWNTHRFVYIYTRQNGQKNLVCVTAKCRVDNDTLPEDDPNRIPEECINVESSGYSTAIALLKGTYDFAPHLLPKISSDLYIRDKELFGTNGCFYIAGINFLGDTQLKSNRAYSLYGFTEDYPYTNSRLVAVREAVNLYDSSYNTKRNPKRVKALDRPFLVAGFPLSTTTLGDDDFFIGCIRGAGEKVHFLFDDSVETQEIEYFDFFDNVMPEQFPKITIDSKPTSPNTQLEITATLHDKPVVNEEVYFTTSAGYLSKKKVTTNEEGKALTTFAPLLLENGDVAEVKCGFKLFSNLANTTISI